MSKGKQRKSFLDKLTEDGYRAGAANLSCDAPVRKSLERAAWENGYQAGKRESFQKKQKQY